MLKFIVAMYVLLTAQALLGQAVSRLPEIANERGGVLVAESGSTEFSTQGASTTAPAGVGALPDAPIAQVSAGATAETAAVTSSNLVSNSGKAKSERGAGTAFWVVTGLLFSSTAANVEVIARCAPTSCQSIPPAIRSRGALYGIGISASAGASYLGYRMKRDGNKWWFLPATILTQANFIYAAHSASWMR
jgi:hypothetical protein